MTTTMRLPCKLTPLEKERRADDLARAVESLEQLRADKAEAVRSFGEQIKSAERRVFDLGDVVRTGHEIRHVPVDHRPDFERNQIHIVRLDTGSVAGSRPMEAHERQAEISYPSPMSRADVLGDDDIDADDSPTDSSH